MMKKTLLITLIVLCCSCGTMNLESRAKNLELGMTKSEVVNLMGNSYRVLNAVKTPDGNLETVLYTSAMGYDYTLNFLDGKLVEWYEMPLPGTEARRDRHYHN